MRRIRSKRLYLTAAGLALMALSSAGCTVYPEPTTRGEADKIYVCHKGKNTLEVAEAALKAHLDHGDAPGPCR